MREYFATGAERCGVITAQGEILECENLAQAPGDAFLFREEDLEGAVATWHTHPQGSSNLSIADYYFFKSWPKLSHFIVSKDDVWCYVIDSHSLVVLVDEEVDHPAWTPGGEASGGY